VGLRDRVIRSLMRFRELVVSSQHQKHFKTLSAVSLRCTSPRGRDGKGDVLFTAYYEPIYTASRVPTADIAINIGTTPSTKWREAASHSRPTRR